MCILCTLFRRGVQCPEIGKKKSSKSRGKKHDISYKPGISFKALNGEIILDLYSDEYELDANDYQKWHLEYKFNLDAPSINTKHKCEVYYSKDKSFLDPSAKDLRNTYIWMFPPIELAEKFLLHYEAIRLQQPDSMMVVICLARITGIGLQTLSKEIQVHSYLFGRHLSIF
jgi:hypothetical protein